MSLILEALRKSEAERRRGSTPDVAMELPPVPAPRARALPGWLLPVAAFALVAVIATWWWSRRNPETMRGVEAVPSSPIAAPRVETPAQPAMADPPAPKELPQVKTPSPAMPRDEAPVVHRPAPPPALPPSIASLPAPPLPPPSADRRDVPDIDATALPPIKLSMHMWDETPARRFVIINGQRMAEGERNGGLVVVSIERDGVVVERNGQRARVPLP